LLCPHPITVAAVPVSGNEIDRDAVAVVAA
jgi:hypothetical protein